MQRKTKMIEPKKNQSVWFFLLVRVQSKHRIWFETIQRRNVEMNAITWHTKHALQFALLFHISAPMRFGYENKKDGDIKL